MKLKLIIFKVYLCTILFQKNIFAIENYTVQTDKGWVAGHDVNGGKYIAFLGIPYALPPIGNRRFKDPLPPAEWEGVLKANRTVKCPQFGDGDEDCLVINVFVPTRATKFPLPVLVHIHEGSFFFGQGPPSGVDDLLKHEIIVVTFNYRLGVFGFLCLGTGDVPGNAGLKDQAAALKWVKTNIKQFGGDPDKVTLYGTSAGAASAHFQILSNNSRPLFHQAIIESAAATSPWALDTKPKSTILNFAKQLNFTYDPKDSKTLVEFLRKIPARKLSLANLHYIDNLVDGTLGFVPCIENKPDMSNSFVINEPYDVLRKGYFKNLPIIIAFGELDGLYITSSDSKQQDNIKQFQLGKVDFAPADFVFDTINMKKKVSGLIRNFYFKNSKDMLVDGLKLLGDVSTVHSVIESVKFHMKDDNIVYLEEFAYKGKLGKYDRLFENITYAGHGDLAKYVFLQKEVINENDQLTVKRLSELISNFVKYGNPTPKPSPLIPLMWPETNALNLTYLRFGKDLEILNKPQWERIQFWEHLYYLFRRNTCTKSNI